MGSFFPKLINTQYIALLRNVEMLHFRMHCIEYFSIMIRKHKIDTIEILSTDDLETVVRRAAKKLPPNCFGTPRDMYRIRLKQVLC